MSVVEVKDLEKKVQELETENHHLRLQNVQKDTLLSGIQGQLAILGTK
jgi:hypothetical protein